MLIMVKLEHHTIELFIKATDYLFIFEDLLSTKENKYNQQLHRISTSQNMLT